MDNLIIHFLIQMITKIIQTSSKFLRPLSSVLFSSSPLVSYQFPVSTIRFSMSFQNKNKKFPSSPQGSQSQNKQQLKKQSKQFYESHVQKITQLKSSAQFQKLVLSIKQPIILDLYADWCQPCKKLTPRLESKVNSLNNVKMVKINIDKCPQIAHALQVKSVPTVFLVYQGQAIDKIQGNVGEAEFNKFFDSINKITGQSPQQKQAIKILQQAKTCMGQKKFEQAAQILQKFKQKKVPVDMIAIKQLLLTQCYLILKKVSKFKDSLSRAGQHEQFLKQVPDLNQFYEILKKSKQQLESQQNSDPQLDQMKSKIESASTKQQKLQAKYQLVQHYSKKQMHEQALQTAMEIIKQDKNWSQKKTNKFVLQIFKQLGKQSPLVAKYRKILQRLLS